MKVLGEISIHNFIASYSSYGFNFLNLYSVFAVSIKVWGQMSNLFTTWDISIFDKVGVSQIKIKLFKNQNWILQNITNHKDPNYSYFDFKKFVVFLCDWDNWNLEELGETIWTAWGWVRLRFFHL